MGRLHTLPDTLPHTAVKTLQIAYTCRQTLKLARRLVSFGYMQVGINYRFLSKQTDSEWLTMFPRCIARGYVLWCYCVFLLFLLYLRGVFLHTYIHPFYARFLNSMLYTLSCSWVRSASLSAVGRSVPVKRPQKPCFPRWKQRSHRDGLLRNWLA